MGMRNIIQQLLAGFLKGGGKKAQTKGVMRSNHESDQGRNWKTSKKGGE